jgi:hypothetical protein
MNELPEKRPTGRVLRLVLLALLLVALLILLILNRRQGTISMALWWVMWLGNLLYKAVPQKAYWVLFLLAALVISIASLVRRRRRVEEAPSEPPARSGRVQHLAVMVRRADGSPYAKWQLARVLGRLTTEKLARQGPGAVNGTLNQVLEAAKDAPPEVLAYLEAGLDHWPYEHIGFLRLVRRLFRIDAPIGALDLDPERVVEYLEDDDSRWEDPHDR